MASSAPSQKPTLTFFGATGGCTAQTLALALLAGYQATALARHPAKLTELLATTYSVPSSVLESNLTIIHGDAKDPSRVRSTLYYHDRLADIIIFGIGSFPKLQANFFEPVTLNDPHVCADAMAVVVDSLRSIRNEQLREGRPALSTPLVLAISTTGVQKARDVPLAYLPLYHWLLSVPHADKRIMEETLVGACERANDDNATGPLATFVIVRPSLLMDGPPKGNIRVGWEHPAGRPKDIAGTEKAPGPAIGYTIRRSDVGSWIFEQVVQDSARAAKWGGKCVTLTY